MRNLIAYVLLSAYSASSMAGISDNFEGYRNYVKSLSSSPAKSMEKLELKDIPHTPSTKLNRLYSESNSDKEYLKKYALESVKNKALENAIHNNGSTEKHDNEIQTNLDAASDGIIESKSVEKNSDEISDKSNLFCSDGKCSPREASQSYVFEEAASELSSASGAAEEVNKSKSIRDAEKTRIFSGHAVRCAKRPVGFLDCCSDKGWGKDLNLAKCPSEDRKLGMAKLEYKAHYIGQYCAKRIRIWPFGSACVKTNRTYCIFPSKLSRIIREQGPHAIKGVSKGFGSAEYPDCSGFLPKEFQNIELSKINFKNPIYPFNPRDPFGASSSTAAGVSVDLNRTPVDKDKLEERANSKTKAATHGRYIRGIL